MAFGRFEFHTKNLKAKMRRLSDLPEEIVLAILSRVPAKTVGLCRCVSKPWRALLSEPDFIKTHLHLSRLNPQESLVIFSYSEFETLLYSAPLNNAHHLFDQITLSPTKLTFPGHPQPHSWPSWDRAYASCDGLLLVRDVQNDVFVVNPLTREIRQVPHSPFGPDPQVSYPQYGFGYDSVSDDYKIVTVYHYCAEPDEPEPGDDDETFIDVYSLKTGSWKKAESWPYEHVEGEYFDAEELVFVGGCLHWLARRTTDDTDVIVAFDLVEEKFREVPSPSSNDLGVDCYLALLGGCLCKFGIDLKKEVWVMKEYGVAESWTKCTVGDPNGYFDCFLGSQEQVVMTFWAGKDVMWNVKQRTLKEIVINGNLGTTHVKASFVESLVSPQCKFS